MKTPHSLSRPGSKLRPRTKERGRSRGDSRPNTRGSLGSTSRASTPQLVEPLKPVDPKTAAAASLLSFQIRHIGSRESSRQSSRTGRAYTPPIAPQDNQGYTIFPPIDIQHGQNENERKRERKLALRKQKRIARMKRLRDLQTGVEFNQGALFKVIRKGITADTTAEEIREMVEDNADDSIRELSPIKQRIKTILDYDTANTDDDRYLPQNFRLDLTKKTSATKRSPLFKRRSRKTKRRLKYSHSAPNFDSKRKQGKRKLASSAYFERQHIKSDEKSEKRAKFNVKDITVRPDRAQLGDGLSFHQSIKDFFTENRGGIRDLKSPRSMQGIPMEMLVREDVLTELTEEARKSRKFMGENMQGNVDKVLLSLPSEFLFSMRLESYATMKGIGSITRVLKRLITGVVEEAWSRWWNLVEEQRERERQEARDNYRKKRGRDALQLISNRLQFGSMFKGFNTWKRAAKRMRFHERYNAASTIQRHWRGVIGRRYHATLKANLQRWKRQILLLDWAERRWRLNRAAERALLKKQNNASSKITQFFRLVVAMRDARARKKAQEQAELEARMAVRVQCAWRCRQGRFSLFLKREAQKMREEEERIASIKIQSIGRGWLGRNVARGARLWKENEKKAKEALHRMFKKAMFLCFDSWKCYSQRMGRVKAMMRRAITGLKGRLFIVWRENAISLKNTREDVLRREEELLRAELRRKRKQEEDERKIRAALQRMRNRHLSVILNTWIAYRNQMRELKRRMVMHMVQKERTMFERWIQYVREEKEMRADAKRRTEIEHQRWLAEQERERKERERKVRMALNRMLNRLLCTSFSSWSAYTARMKRVKGMMRRALLYKTRLRFEHWWGNVEERREQMATASMYLRRMLNRRVYVAFESWMQYYLKMRRVKEKMRLKMMGKKRYFFMNWRKSATVQEAIRHLMQLNQFKKTRTRLVGLSKARLNILNQTMAVLPDEYEREELLIVREAVHAITHFQELEEQMALRVQAAWRGKNGRLAYQMKMHAKRELEAEQLAATLKMQRLFRGHTGRKLFLKRKEQKVKDDLKAKYVRERQRELDRERWYREAEEVALRESMMEKKRAESEIENARLRMEKAKLEAEQAKYEADQKRLHAEAMGWGPGGSGDQAAHPSGWMMVPDQDNNIYYYNVKTGASQWERPAELGGAEATNEDDAWIELPSGDGKVYWYNTITHASTWDDPNAANDRIPKFQPTFCDCDACDGKETRAVRECQDCKKNFCLACYIEFHRTKRRAEHAWEPVLQPSDITLTCSNCPGVAERFCEDCDKNFCENCYLWDHSEGIKSQHESKAFIRGAPICIECENRIAEVQCVECSDVFCKSCYKKQHRSGTKRNHTSKPVQVFKENCAENEEYCISCEIRVADRACDSCGDPYCKKCFEADHSKGFRSEHTWTPWDKLTGGRDWVEINDEESGRVLYFNIKTRQTTEKKPLGLMSGKERASVKKRQAAEREMKVRLEKEAELLGLREKMQEMEKLAQEQEEQISELARARAPEEEKKKGWFRRGKSKSQKKKDAKLKKGKMKDFLKDRLITAERQKELDDEKNSFGSELYERNVLDSLSISMPETEKKGEKRRR